MNYDLSFQELAKLQKKILSKQRPFTLEEKRAQIIHVAISSSNNNEYEIKRHLKMYYPNWTEKQIENEYNEMQTIFSGNNDSETANKLIANRLTKIKSLTRGEL